MLDDSAWVDIVSATHRLWDSQIFIDDSTDLTVSEMRSRCRRIAARHGLDLIVIDYLQLMRAAKG
jgi:replicative DNA helicase